MITIPPRYFFVVENLVIKIIDGLIEFDASGQAKLAFADQEIRFNREPFSLYSGEMLKKYVTPLIIVPANSALRLTEILDFNDEVSG